MKKIIWIVIVILIIGGLVWWKQSKDKVSLTGEPIKVGVAVDLNGYAANWGESEVRAVQLALDKYKDQIDQPIELIIENTKGDGLGTVNAVKKLIEINKVESIIGPTWGDSFQGALPIAENAKIVMLSPSSAIETFEVEEKNKYTYFFSTWWPQKYEIDILVDHMSSAGGGKLAFVNDEDAFNIEVTNSLIDEAKTRPGVTIVSRDVVPIGTKDFRTIIAKMRVSKPTAAFIQMQDTSVMGPFMKQLKEQNVNIPVYATPDAENADNVKKFPGVFDGLLYAFPSYGNDPAFVDLSQRFTTKFGTDASRGPSFVNAYNAATMLFEVMKNGARTGTEIRDALGKLHMSGVGTKNLSFTPLGQLSDVTFVMKTIKDNKFIELEK